MNGQPAKDPAPFVFAMLCAMAFCIPWEEVAVILQNVPVIFAMGCLTIAGACMAVLARGRLRRPPPVLFILGLFVAWNLASILWATDFKAALTRGLTYVSLWFFVWMAWEFSASEKRVLQLFRAYIAGCCVSLALLYADYVQGGGSGSPYVRWTGGGLNQDDFATVIDLAVPLAVYLACRQDDQGPWARRFYWGFVIATGVGVFLTGTRTGVLALGPGLVLGATAARAKRAKALLALGLAAACTGWLVNRMVSQETFERLEEGSSAHTFEIRMRLWQAGWSYWQEHPLLGCGTDNFQTVVAPKAGEAFIAHNTAISVLAELGLVGFCLFAAFWLALVRAIFELEGPERRLWLAVFAVWAICAMALTFEYRKSTWLMFALALTHSAARTDRRLAHEPA